jgi:hypothetical protein
MRTDLQLFSAPILLFKQPSVTALAAVRNDLKMVLPHHTPYVTPQILHKNYAQAHDTEQFGTCKSAKYFDPILPS